MKKIMAILMALTVVLMINESSARAFTFDQRLSDDSILLMTGMSQNEINEIDKDFKRFIVEDLIKSGKLSSMEFIGREVNEIPEQRVNQVLSGITFTATAFKSGSIIYIYPTYEFTTNKKPAGADSFSFQLGNAMEPYDYGGALWAKDEDLYITNWVYQGSITANNQGFNGAEYSGSQLGTPSHAVKFKGAAYCHANVGNGTDKRIIMSYLHNPMTYSYSINFSVSGVGITYNSPNTVYTASMTVVLSY